MDTLEEKIKELWQKAKTNCWECLELHGCCSGSFCGFFEMRDLIESIYQDTKQCKDKHQTMN